MNYIVTSILTILFIIHSVLSIPYKEVEAAFSTGDAVKVMDLTTAKVLISIEGNEGVYSKSQGMQVLNVFFKKNPPQSFSFKFKGNEEKSSSFAVGDYQSNQKYRVSIKFKKGKEQHLIESINITTCSR